MDPKIRMAKIAELRDRVSSNCPDDIAAMIHSLCDEVENIEADMKVLKQTLLEYQKNE